MTEESGYMVRIERTFDARAEDVFDAWTSPEVMRRWLHCGPDWETPTAEVDLRVGGRVRVVMRRPDGNESGMGGEYTLIERPHRLVMTWTFDDDPSQRAADRALVHGGRGLDDGADGQQQDLADGAATARTRDGTGASTSSSAHSRADLSRRRATGQLLLAVERDDYRRRSGCPDRPRGRRREFRPGRGPACGAE